jgi:hypothetical protein
MLVLENEENVQQGYMLPVPRKVFVNLCAQPFQKCFMMEPVDQGNEQQKLLIDSLEWKTIEECASSLLNDPTSQAISGISLQNLDDRKDVKKESCNGHVVEFSTTCTLEMYPIVVLGGGDTEWVACSLGKENMAGVHCSHCQWSKIYFHLRHGKLWTLESILAAMARTFQDDILVLPIQKKPGCPTWHDISINVCIPIIHLWASRIIHRELGLVNDLLTRVEKFEILGWRPSQKRKSTFMNILSFLETYWRIC